MEDSEKICKRCGKSYPLTNYSSHPKTYDGKRSICKQCSSNAILKGINKSKHIQNDKVKVINKFKQTQNNYIIELDFNEHKNIFDKICAIAKQELRTPENQIIYMIITDLFSDEIKNILNDQM